MPNCFQLISKETGQPTAFNKIDDDICASLGIVPDAVKYYRGWYDFIGFMIAIGKPLGSKELRKEVEDVDKDLLPVLDFLEQHYTSDAWAQIGRRD
jgi:hypothetical protein